MKLIHSLILCIMFVAATTLYAASNNYPDSHSIEAKESAIQKSTTEHQPNKLITDAITTNQPNKKKLYPLFDPLYIKKGPATDCSFISAFMLMLNHDPDYPFKILTKNEHSYTIKYPGLDHIINVSDEEVNIFNQTIENRKSWQNFFSRGHNPAGIEILRSAYYKYQRETGQRDPEYQVYNGGIPIKDLMILSGIKQGKKIYAVPGFSNVHKNKISFANGLEQQLTIHLENGLFFLKKEGDSIELGNPFTALDEELSAYLITASSVYSISFMDNLFGTNIISNHAYYFIGIDSTGNYILGDSYDTQKPVHISPQEFIEKFNTIEYVKKQ